MNQQQIHALEILRHTHYPGCPAPRAKCLRQQHALNCGHFCGVREPIHCVTLGEYAEVFYVCASHRDYLNRLFNKAPFAEKTPTRLEVLQ